MDPRSALAQEGTRTTMGGGRKAGCGGREGGVLWIGAEAKKAAWGISWRLVRERGSVEPTQTGLPVGSWVGAGGGYRAG